MKLSGIAAMNCLDIEAFENIQNLTDVYAAVIPDFPYRPGVHVHYQETKLHIKDGLPKMKDVPKEMGGSGATVAE